MNDRPRWTGWPDEVLGEFDLRQRPVLAMRAAGKIDKDEALIRLCAISEELGCFARVDWSPWEEGGYVLPWNRRAPEMQPREVTGR